MSLQIFELLFLASLMMLFSISVSIYTDAKIDEQPNILSRITINDYAVRT